MRLPDARPSPPLVVELCGLPGAGKTTLADALVTGLRANGIEAMVGDKAVSAAAPRALRLLRKAVAATRVLCAHPVTEARVARLLGGDQRSSRDAVALPLQWWVTKNLLLQSRRRSADVVVLEEGLVQALWSAGLRSPRASAARLVTVAGASAPPDLVVLVDVPERLAIDRITSRASRHSRVQRMSGTEQLDLMQEGAALLDALLDEWRARDLAGVVALDGGSPDCAAELAAIIGGLIDARSR